jgi:ATP-dependent DNA helicase RecG
MTQDECLKRLEELLARPNELEWLEFKTATVEFDFEKLGEYFSALSNEANLHGQPAGWLLLGVNARHDVVGTNWKRNPGAMEQLKHGIATHTALGHTFRQIYEARHPNGRVLMFEIPPAPHGVPMSWRGHWYGRDGESIAALNQTKLDAIRAKGTPDWSAEIIQDASIADLDAEAIRAARVGFKKAHANSQLTKECDGWDERTFLNKARLTAPGGKITRTALLLVGKRESAHWLSPADTRMSWILKSADNPNIDHAHFGPPFALTSEVLFGKVRNLTYPVMSDGTLFPIQPLKYDTWVMREVLHNCIAHQDYTMGGRINVVEREDTLRISNLGAFIPQTVDRVLEAEFTPDRYRNPFLANAMVEISMMDTAGSGIRRMFRIQRERGFPLPDYDLSDPGKVVVTIYGKVIDVNYTRALLNEPDLDIFDVIALDMIQKRQTPTETQLKLLRRKGLVQGRKPALYIAARVAKVTGKQVEYVLNSGVGDAHYKALVLKLIDEFGPAASEKINELLLSKLPRVLNQQQKKDKVRNLLQEMAKEDQSIRNVGKRGKGARWART